MLSIINNYFNTIKASLKNEKGQGMVEYALIIGLVAVVLVAALGLLEVDIEGTFTKITNALPN